MTASRRSTAYVGSFLRGAGKSESAEQEVFEELMRELEGVREA